MKFEMEFGYFNDKLVIETHDFDMIKIFHEFVQFQEAHGWAVRYSASFIASDSSSSMVPVLSGALSLFFCFTWNSENLASNADSKLLILRLKDCVVRFDDLVGERRNSDP